MLKKVALLALIASSSWAASPQNLAAFSYGNITVSGTGGGGGGGSQTTPGGITNSVQTNNGTTGSLGGDSSLLYTTGLLNLTGTLSATTLSATTLNLAGLITNGQALYLSGSTVDGTAGQNYNRLTNRTTFDENATGVPNLYSPSTTVLISNSLAVTSFTQIGFTPSHTVVAALEVNGSISGTTYFGDGSHLTGISGGSSTVPASPVNSVQFNNAGAFGGSSNFTWNGTLINLTGGLTATATVSANVLDSFILSTTAINGSNATLTGGLTTASIAASGVVSAGTLSATTLTIVNGTCVGTCTGFAAGSTPASLVSGTTRVDARTDGTISLTTGGSVTGYFDTSGRLITPGISVTTAQTSVTTLFTSGLLTAATISAGQVASVLISATQPTGTVTATNVYAKNVSASSGTFGPITVSGCTGCGGGGGGTAISTTTFTATTNGAGSTDIGFNAAVGTGGSNSTFGVSAGTALTGGAGDDAYGFLALANETTGNDNTAFGTQSLQHQNGASGSVGFGASACQNATTGQHNTCIGFGTGTNIVAGSNNVFLGYQTNNAADVSNFMNLDNVAYAITTNGIGFSQFGINVISPTGNFEVSGTVKFDSLANNAGTGPVCYSSATHGITTNTTACTVSDIRFKKNIEPYNGSLDKVMQLNIRQFDFRDPKVYGAQHQVGLIAQEVEKIIPAVVGTGDDGYKSVSYDKLSAYAIGAIQEQQLEINDLRAAVGLPPKYQTFGARLKWLVEGE